MFTNGMGCLKIMSFDGIYVVLHTRLVDHLFHLPIDKYGKKRIFVFILILIPKLINMGFVKEFKEFALKGNVFELAIAVIIGAAFGAIVSSLVEDVITPLLLTPALDAAGIKDLDKLVWGSVKYGNFIAAVIKFVIIALVLFILLQGINRLKRKKDAPVAPVAPEYSLQEKLLIEIRDSLKSTPRV
jgi:large conductance mechanosensitive channel